MIKEIMGKIDILDKYPSKDILLLGGNIDPRDNEKIIKRLEAVERIKENQGAKRLEDFLPYLSDDKHFQELSKIKDDTSYLWSADISRILSYSFITKKRKLKIKDDGFLGFLNSLRDIKKFKSEREVATLLDNFLSTYGEFSRNEFLCYSYMDEAEISNEIKNLLISSNAKLIKALFVQSSDLYKEEIALSVSEKAKDLDFSIYEKVNSLSLGPCLLFMEKEEVLSLYERLTTLISKDEDKEKTKNVVNGLGSSLLAFSPKEVYSIVYKVLNNEIMEDKLWNQAYVLSFIYPSHKELITYSNEYFFMDYVHHCLKNKRKASLRAIEEGKDSFKDILRIISKCYLYDVLNITSIKDLEEFQTSFYGENNSRMIKKKEFLIKTSKEKNMDLKKFKSFMSLSSGLLESIARDRIKIDYETSKKLNDLSDESIRYITKKADLRDIISMIEKEDSLNLQNKHKLDKKSAETLLIMGESIYSKIKNKKLDSEYISVIKFLSEDTTIVNFDKDYLFKEALSNERVGSALSKLKIDESFTSKHKESLLEFVSKGGHEILLSLLSSYKFTETTSLSKIFKAHIAKRLHHLKFYPGDLVEETGYPLSDKQERIWEENKKREVKEGLTISERYDFFTTISIGVSPVRTCMAYNGGAYVDSLLSNFDANKKILVAEKNGKVVARAILRLTSGSDELKSFKRDSFGFRDVSSDEEIVEVKKSKKSDLIVFLERPYISTLNTEESRKIKEEFSRLAIEKAREMNAFYSHSTEYNGAINEEPFYKGAYYITITKSKNSVQYLDSFGGEKLSNERTNISTSICLYK